MSTDMEYQDHLLHNVYKGDKERFDKDWQQALDEGCEGAVSWKTLLKPKPQPELTRADYQAIKPAFEGMAHSVKNCTYEPYQSWFVWVRN